MGDTLARPGAGGACVLATLVGVGIGELFRHTAERLSLAANLGHTRILGRAGFRVLKSRRCLGQGGFMLLDAAEAFVCGQARRSPAGRPQ